MATSSDNVLLSVELDNQSIISNAQGVIAPLNRTIQLISYMARSPIEDDGETVNAFADSVCETSDAFQHQLALLTNHMEVSSQLFNDAIAMQCSFEEELQTIYEDISLNQLQQQNLEQDVTDCRSDFETVSKNLTDFEKDVETAQENANSARTTRNNLLIGSTALTVFTLGLALPISLPMFFGALGPAQSVLDKAEKAKKSAQVLVDEKKRELKRLLVQVEVLEKLDKKCKENLEILYDKIVDQLILVQQLKLYHVELNKCHARLQRCHHVLKTLDVRQAIVLMQTPAVGSVHLKYLIYSVRCVVDMVKPIFGDALEINGLPAVEFRVQAPMALTGYDELAIMDERYGNMNELFCLMPTAILALKQLCLLSSTQSNKTDSLIESFITSRVHESWQALSDLHCTFDGIKILAKIMREAFADCGRQMVLQVDHQMALTISSNSAIDFQNFDNFVSFLQLCAEMGCMKTTTMTAQLEKCCKNLALICEYLLEAESNTNDQLVELGHLRSKLDLDNNHQRTQFDEFSSQVAEIKTEISSQQEAIHSGLGEVKLDPILLATDVSLELAMDVVFFMVPFLRAAEFLDEALVAGRYLAKQIAKFKPLIDRCFKSSKRESKKDKKAKLEAYAHSKTLIEFSDRMEDFIDEEGRLNVDLLRSKEHNVIREQLGFYIEIVSQLPETTVLGELLTILVSGRSICHLLETVRKARIDGTTSEADELVEEIRQFIARCHEFHQAASGQIKSPDPSPNRWYTWFLNGFTGCKACHKLFLAQSAIKHLRSTENDADQIGRKQNQAKKRLEAIQARRMLLVMDTENFSSRLQSILQLQSDMAKLKLAFSNVNIEMTKMQQALKYAFEKIATIEPQANQSMESVLQRRIIYERVFDAIKIFDSLDSFIDNYLVISNQHYLPLVNSLSEVVGLDEGADPDLSDKLDNFDVSLAQCQGHLAYLLDMETAKLASIEAGEG